MGVVASIGYTDYFNVVHKVDIDLDGYVGSITELTGTDEPIKIEYERLNTSQIFSTQLTKANVTIGFYVDESASLAVVSALIAATEGNYKLLYYKGGVLDLTVDVLADQITFNESSAGRFATVTGKDFSNLSAKSFPLSDVRKPIIEVIADCLKLTGYDLPITTCTSWVNTQQSNVANDFLRELNIDTIALREYANEQTGADSAIGATDALEFLLRNFKLFLKQADGRFYLDQLSAYTNPASVLRTLYDKDGAFVSDSTLSKSVAVPNASPYRALLGQSENSPIASFKRVKSLFNHRLVPSGIVMPQSINFPQLDLLPRSFGQDFIPNDERRLSFSSNVQVTTTTQIPNGSGIQIEIRSGDRWWNIQTQQWVSNVGLRNDFTLSDLIFTQPNPPPTEPPTTPPPPIVALGQLSDFVYTTVVTINTTPIPLIGGGAITITLYPFEGQPSTTTYTGSEFAIVGIFGEKLETSEAFQLEQSLNSSVSYDDGVVLYGDGPTVEANSAIRYGSDDADITVGGWYRRGGAQDWIFSEILLKEVMEFQRSFVRSINAIILGDYRASDIAIYDSTAFYFIGGSHDIYNGQWSANVVAIAFSDATDSLNVNVISGPAQLSTGFYSAINQSIGKTLEAGGMIAFRLAVAITPGSLSSITISGTLGNDYLFRTGNSLKVVHPVTGQSLDLTVATNQVQGSNIILVDLVSVNYTFPISSWVFVSQETITTSITILRDQIELFSRSSAVGALTSNVAGTVTSVEINLWAQIREGDDLLIVNPLLSDPIPIYVRGNYNNGVRTVDISETIVQAPLGSYVIRSGSQTQAQFFVDPGRLQGKVIASQRSNGIAVLDGDLAVGTYTSIPITSPRPITLKSGFVLGVEDIVGNISFFIVDGNQVLNSATNITVLSATTSSKLLSGAAIFQTGYNQTSELLQLSDAILLRVTETQVTEQINNALAGITPAENWTFLNTAEGFVGTNATVTPQPTLLNVVRTGNPSYIELTGLTIDASDNPFVYLEIQRIAGTNWGVKFGFEVSTVWYETPFSEPSDPDTAMNPIQLDLRSNGNWTGTVTGVRVFFGGANNDEYDINVLRIGKFDSQAEQISDLQGRMTVAEGNISVTAGEVDIFTAQSALRDRLARVTATYNQLSTYTTITLDNIRSGIALKNGQSYYLVNIDGTFQLITINGNQDLDGSIEINSVEFATTIETGAYFVEADWTQTSRINANAGEITALASTQTDQGTAISGLEATTSGLSAQAVLKAQTDGDGNITGLAVVQLDASPGFGAISLIANSTVSIRAGSGNVIFNDNGITMQQADASNDTEIKRSLHWINSEETANQSRIVSYASGSNIAVDVAGTNSDKDVRFSVRRNIAVTTREFDIGVVGNAGAFNDNTLVGDSIIKTNSRLFVQGDGATNIINFVVNGSRIGIGNLASDPNYKFNVTGTSNFTNLEANNIIGRNGITAGATSTTGLVTIRGTSGVGQAEIKFVNSANLVRELTIPTLDGARTFSFINQNETISGTRRYSAINVFDPSTLFVLETATLEHGVFINTLSQGLNRTATIPNLGGDRTFSFIDLAQTFSAVQTFSETIVGSINGNAGTVTNGVYTTGNQTIGGTKTFSSFIKLGFTIGIDFLVEDNVADPVTISLEPENGGTAGNKVATIPNATGTLVTTGAYNQTIGGVKTFSSTIVGSINGNSATVTDGVYLSTVQTISGAKTFTGNVIVPDSTTSTHALRVGTADARYGRLGAGNTFSGSNEYTGLNTFYFGNLLLRNTGDTGSATINYGTASADRTYTFIGASSNVLTDARGLQFEGVSGASLAIDSAITIILPSGARYSIPAQFEP